MHISRVTRTKGEARKAYNRLSPHYDLFAGAGEWPLVQSGIEMLAVKEGESVLEIGPGTGNGTLKLTRLVGMKGRVFALDLSRGMLAIAYRRLLKAGQGKRALLIEGDGEMLPVKKSSFSAVFLSFTLELFDTPDIPTVIAECHRVLQPGGRLGIVSMGMGEPPGSAERIYGWFHAHLPLYADCRPINAGEFIRQGSFSLEVSHPRRMWGLPVDILVAKKT